MISSFPNFRRQKASLFTCQGNFEQKKLSRLSVFCPLIPQIVRFCQKVNTKKAGNLWKTTVTAELQQYLTESLITKAT